MNTLSYCVSYNALNLAFLCGVGENFWLFIIFHSSWKFPFCCKNIYCNTNIILLYIKHIQYTIYIDCKIYTLFHVNGDYCILWPLWVLTSSYLLILFKYQSITWTEVVVGLNLLKYMSNLVTIVLQSVCTVHPSPRIVHTQSHTNIQAYTPHTSIHLQTHPTQQH